MTTFSQLVDQITVELLRPDLKAQIASYANQTVRELHFSETNRPLFYGQSLLEDTVTSTVESNLLWTPPKPTLFQALHTARYDNVLDTDGSSIYPKELVPGRVQERARYFYYRTGDSYGFAGFGGLNAVISLAWYEYVPSLAYYPVGATRPAELDEFGVWTYSATYDVDAASRAAAELLVTHWMISRWSSYISEGVKAKVYKGLGDDRARVSFSLYQDYREQLRVAESHTSLER